MPQPKTLIDRGFWERMELPAGWQLGIAVADMAEAITTLSDVGLGPTVCVKGRAKPWIERGEERRFIGQVGVAHASGLQLELLGAGEGSEFYGEAIDPGKTFTLHHLGFLDHHLKGRMEQFNAAGYGTAVRGCIRIPVIKYTIDFLYLDCREDVGFYIEFIDCRLFGVPVKPTPMVLNLLATGQETYRMVVDRLVKR